MSMHRRYASCQRPGWPNLTGQPSNMLKTLINCNFPNNMKLLLTVSLLLFAFVFIVTQPAALYACSCEARDATVKAMRSASAVFIGTVKTIRNAADHDGFSDLKVSFDVETVLKNSKLATSDVYTSSQGTACGFPFVEGEQYLVFAELLQNSLQTSICSRTRYVQWGSPDDEIEVLRTVSKGRLEPRIYGTVYELTRGIYPLRKDYWDERRSMPGITVIARSGDHMFEAVSDEHGRFRVKNVVPGLYRLTFKVPDGYKVGGDEWDESTKDERKYYKNLSVSVTSSDNPDGLTIEVRVDGRIKGTVVDQYGTRVGKDVSVTLVSKETAGREIGDIDYVDAYTDSNGQFEFFGIPKGEYYVGFNLDLKPNKGFPFPRTYYPSTTNLANATPIVLTRGERLSGFQLQLPNKVPEIEVKGVVVDSAGVPIKGAIVETYGLYYGDWRPEDGYSMKYIKQPVFEGRVKTDEKGGFVLHLLKGNRYRLNPYLEQEGSYKDLLRGKEVDVEVSDDVKPISLVLNQKPE